MVQLAVLSIGSPLPVGMSPRIDVLVRYTGTRKIVRLVSRPGARVWPPHPYYFGIGVALLCRKLVRTSRVRAKLGGSLEGSR